MEGGDSMGALRIRTSSRPPGRAKRGRQRRPAARVASLPTRRDSGVPFKVSLRCFLHSDFDINKSFPPTGSKKVPASMGEPTASSEQSREGREGRASGRGGGEGRGSATSPGERHAGRCGAGPSRALRPRPRSRLLQPLALA